MFNFSDYYGVGAIILIMIIVFLLYCSVGFRADARAKRAMKRVKMQKATEMNFNTVEEYEAFIAAQSEQEKEKAKQAKKQKKAAKKTSGKHNAESDENSVMSVENGQSMTKNVQQPVFSGSMEDIAKGIDMEDIQHLIAEQNNPENSNLSENIEETIKEDIEEDIKQKIDNLSVFSGMDSVDIPNEALGEQIRKVAADAAAESSNGKLAESEPEATVVIPKADMMKAINKTTDQQVGEKEQTSAEIPADKAAEREKVQPAPIIDESSVDTGNGQKLGIDQIREMLKNAKYYDGKEELNRTEQADMPVPPATPYVQSIPRILNTKEAIAVPAEAPKVTTFYPDGKVVRDNKVVKRKSFYRNEYDTQSKNEENEKDTNDVQITSAKDANEVSAEIKHDEKKDDTLRKTVDVEVAEAADNTPENNEKAEPAQLQIDELNDKGTVDRVETDSLSDKKSEKQVSVANEIVLGKKNDIDCGIQKESELAGGDEDKEKTEDTDDTEVKTFELTQEVKDDVAGQDIQKEDIQKENSGNAVSENAASENENLQNEDLQKEDLQNGELAVEEKPLENSVQDDSVNDEPTNSNTQNQQESNGISSDEKSEATESLKAEDDFQAASEVADADSANKKSSAFSRMKEKFSKKSAKNAVNAGGNEIIKDTAAVAAGTAAASAAGKAVSEGVQNFASSKEKQNENDKQQESQKENTENRLQNDILMPEKPKAFGYEMAWLAIPNMGSAEVLKALGLKDIAPANWTKGLTSAYENNDTLFVTPNLSGWTLVIGHALWQKIDISQPIEKSIWLQKLADSFREVFYFSSGSDLKNHGWFYIRDGLLVRAYGYSGELDEVMWNFGPESQEEHKLIQGFSMGKTKVVPTEKDVLTLAAAWSVDPTFSHDNYRPDIGFMGKL